MTKDEALKMAIDYLELQGFSIERQATLEACKEAIVSDVTDIDVGEIAQPTQEEKFCDGNCVWTDHHPNCKLAQPAQEPYGYWVEYEYGEEKGFDMSFRYPNQDDYYPSKIKSVTKLYTHPAPSCSCKDKK